MKVISYIKLHWEGQLPLTLSYLANYLLVSALCGLYLWQLIEIVDWNAGLFQRGVIIYSLFFVAALYGWGAIGALRALLKIHGDPILYLAYPLYAIGVIRFVRYFWRILGYYFG